MQGLLPLSLLWGSLFADLSATQTFADLTAVQMTSSVAMQPMINKEIAPEPVMIESVFKPARSYGWPWRGRLRDAVYLPESDTIRHVDAYRAHDNFWGSHAMVGLLQRVSRRVTEQHGPGRMAVGELSNNRGGRILGHRSHQNGRDVDIGFYMVDERNHTVAWPSFVYLWRSGKARVGGEDDRKMVYMDVARNWTLVESLALDPQVAVQHIFVANSMKRILFRYARKKGVPEEIQDRVSRMMMPAGSGRPHTDHFHVRIYCPRSDRPRCKDKGPYWPWSADLHGRAPLARW